MNMEHEADEAQTSAVPQYDIEAAQRREKTAPIALIGLSPLAHLQGSLDSPFL